MYASVGCMPVYRSQKRALDVLELESQMSVSCMWKLGTKPGSSGRAALNPEPSLHLQHW